MRKLIVALALVLVVLPLSSVMAQDEEESTYDPSNIAWTCPEGFEGQTLNVYNWATYIAAETVATFEELCGVTVVYDVYDSNESLVARLRQGNPGYDIAFPTDYVVPVMALDEQIVPLQKDLIANIENIADRWDELITADSLEYVVPYMWGSTGLAYNTTRVEGEITSWMQFFEHDGPVAWLSDPRVMMSIALRVLGYEPNTTNPDEIAAARDFLVEHSANVVAIAPDDGQALLERGEVDMVVEYAGDVYQVITECACEDYAYVIPEEGTSLFIDSMVVLNDAPNEALAYAFIDYILDPYVNGNIVNQIIFPTANQAAIDSGFILPELVENPAVFPPDEALAESWFLEYLGEDDLLYYDAWDELLILIGK